MNRRLVRRLGGLAGVATLAAGAVLVPLTDSSTAQAEEGPPPDVSERRVLTDEHVDAINVGFDGSSLTIDSKIGLDEFVEVDGLIYHLSDLAYIASLPDEFREFVGSDDVWAVPQSQLPGVIWVGWNTEDIGSGVLDGDTMDITLVGVEGPGEVEVFQVGSFGEILPVFSSQGGPVTRTERVNTHVHAEWWFTEPGVYTLTFAASATVGGQAVESEPIEYTWVIGGDSGVLPDPVASTTVLQAPSSAEPGEQVSLSAGVSTDTAGNAPPEPGGYVEFRDGDESLGWTGIVEGEATLLVSFDDTGEHEVTATYVPQEPQFYAGSDSEPMTIVVDDPPGGEDGSESGGEDGSESGAEDGTESGTENGSESGAEDGDENGGEDPPGDEDGDGDPPDQCEDPRTMLTDEHTDLLTPAIDGTELELRAKVGSANDHTFYDPGDVLVQVKDPEAHLEVPDGDSHAFLGEPGDDLWVIPQTQNPDVVWAGWSTEELAPGDLEGDAVDMTLTDVDGPGFVEVFQTGGLGSTPVRIFSSQDDLDSREQSVGQHVHANWAFSELGEYTLTFEVTGTLADGTEVSTGEVDYAFVIGEPECDPGGDETGGDESGGDETGGDETGGDETGGDETGGDASGDDNGGDASGADDGTDAGGDESGGDETGTETGDVVGADTGGESGSDESGGDDGAGPKPTTKPTNGVCPRGSVPAGSQPSASPSSDDVAQDGDEPGGDNGNDGGSGTDSGSDDDGGPSGEQVVLTNEHVDLLSPRLSGSELSLQAKVGSANDHTFYDPADVLVQVKPEAASTVPDGDGYGFLGDAGDPIWLIPETQDPQIVWAGWSTEELSSGDFQGDAVDLRMVDVQGPGELEVFQTTGFGDVSRIFSSTDSLDARRQSVGQHVHANWAFSAEGEYTVTFEVSGTLAGGDTVTTGSVEYSFMVGEPSGPNAASSTGASAVISPALHTGSGPATVSAATQMLPDTGSADEPEASTEVLAASDKEDCVLASTGTSGASGTVIIGGVLVLLGGAAALYAYRRRGVTLT